MITHTCSNVGVCLTKCMSYNIPHHTITVIIYPCPDIDQSLQAKRWIHLIHFTNIHPMVTECVNLPSTTTRATVFLHMSRHWCIFFIVLQCDAKPHFIQGHIYFFRSELITLLRCLLRCFHAIGYHRKVSNIKSHLSALLQLHLHSQLHTWL